MASNLRNGDYGEFDHNADRSSSGDGKSLLKFLFGFLTNRYLVLSLIFCVFGVIILVMTTRLQFSDYQNKISEGSTGVIRQYVSEAPRGDIYDSRGVLLASTVKYNTIMLANAYLKDDELNSLCLELSNLFERYNCIPVADLDQYFVMEPTPMFVKSDEKIRLWQTDSNLFALEDFSEGVIVTFSDNYVKRDPEVFFLYLRQKFGLDNNYSVEDAYKIIRIRYQLFAEGWSFIKGTPVKIATDVPEELINMLREKNYHYMGIVAGQEYARTYSPEALYSCHVLGYVGPISQDSYSTLSQFGYSSDDSVGKSGVESQMERYLHGDSGITPYNIWTTEGEEGFFVPANYGIKPKSGATVNLTIDTRIQEVGTEALKDYIKEGKQKEAREQKGYKTASSGAFVMMNVKTGAVIAMGSYPNFDPNDFILANYGDEQAQEQVDYYLGRNEYDKITASDLPLWNRAIMSMYAPGSTFKPITALAGLESGKITPNSNWIGCYGGHEVDGWKFRCLEEPETGHGPLSLNSAMATSCNIYFIKLGVDTGIDRLSEMAGRFGLGKRTGVDLPGEIKGVMSSREYKRLTRAKEGDKIWFPSNTAQVSIGQFDNCFTIMQLCRYTAGIATNKLVKPYVVDSVVGSDGSILYQGQTEAADIGIDEDNIQAVRNAMRYAAIGTSQWNSTAQKYLKNFKVELACKTGTAETGYEEQRKEYSNGLFICFAPKSDPEIAIALVVEKGEWGSSTAVIAKKLLAAYFNEQNDTSVQLNKKNPILGDILAASN